MLIRRVSLLLLALLGSGLSGAAEELPHARLEAPLHVIRVHGDRNISSFEGIWTYDPVAGSYARVHPLVFNINRGGNGAFLTASADTLFLAGPAYYEFELPSYRFVRRYNGMPPGSFRWAFHGALVTAADAEALGIESGFYGMPICADTGSIAIFCGPIQPPGYTDVAGNRTDFGVLLRRGTDPADRELHFVRRLAAPIPGLNVSNRQLTLDRGRRRFWSWVEGDSGAPGSHVEALSVIPLAGSVGTETIVESRTTDVLRHSLMFHHHPATDALYQTFEDEVTFRFLRRSATTLAEEVLQIGDPVRLDLPWTATSVPGALPAEYTQTIPIVGELQGANGVSWHSDLWLYNPSGQPTSAVLRRVTSGAETTVTLAAHASLAMPSVLRTLGGEGIDGLTVRSPYRWEAQLVATSRTYSPAPGGGELAQAVPAVPGTAGYSSHLAGFDDADDVFLATQSMFILDRRDPARLRHNLGIVNDSPAPLNVRLRLGTLSSAPADGAPFEQTVSVAPHSVRIVAVEQLFAAETLDSRPPRLWIAADRPAPIWMSVVDNISSDATFVPYELFSFRGDELRLAVPGIPSADWTTDLYGYFPPIGESEPEQQPLVRFYPGGGCASAETRPAGVIPLKNAPPFPDFWISVFADIVRSFAPCGMTTLDLRSGSWTAGYARIHNGGVSDLLPFLPHNGWTSRHFAGVQLDATHRGAVIVYNGSDQAATNTILIHDSGGAVAATKQAQLAPHETASIPLELENGLYGITITAGANGRVWPYVVVSDTASGDRLTWW
jgi:hypothetical protein